ncbi:hypothetical protein AGLY_014761 [Aphis glycines]|uniref:PiggyBac transposable element-derived protein domain-containing protein n=1 Tax=Aphis glycines TaxID=307491 RepID=A0A6G0T471_APHGL|nr:hypothetical protein AGLY_014761 [Aphis glycines]
MSENVSSWLKELEEINYLEDSDGTDADPDYVDCANEHIENEYDDSDDDFSESNRSNSKRSIIIPRERSRSRSPLPEPSYYLGKYNITKCYTGNHRNLDDLWSDDGLVPPYFRAVMSKARFYILLRTLRFDDIGTRATRKQIDKLTPIRTLLNNGLVDVVDELKGEYSVSRISCRWPLTIFFSLMNIAGINSQIIPRENSGKILSRREFLKNLGNELTKRFMINRFQQPNLSISLRQEIIKLSGHKTAVNVDQISSSGSRPKCTIYPKKK